MPIACVKKTPAKTSCGRDIATNEHTFGDIEYAFRNYDASAVSRPDPKRLWACADCIKQIAKDKAAEEGGVVKNFGSLIDQDKTRT